MLTTLTQARDRIPFPAVLWNGLSTPSLLDFEREASAVCHRCLWCGSRRRVRRCMCAGSSTTTTSPWAGTAILTQFLQTFVESPPRQKATSFTIDQAVAKLEAALTTGR